MAKNILVRAPNWIGDAVMSLPALSALKALHPDANVMVLAKPWTIPVYENNPDVSTIIEFGSEYKGILGKFRLGRMLRGGGFEAAILLPNSFEAAFLSFWARIPKRIGYGRDMRSMLLTKAVEATEEIRARHHVFYYMNLIKAMGADISLDGAVPVPVVSVSDAERRAAEEILKLNGIDDLNETLLVGMAPGASFGSAKRWPVVRFRELAELLFKEYGGIGRGRVVPVIFGAGADVSVAEELSKEMGSIKHINLAGGTTLREFFGVTSLCNLFITNDSGPMHVAAALGVATVAIFGSTDTVVTAPVGNSVKVVSLNMDCSPCFKRECPDGDAKCLTDITAEEVFTSALELMGKE
ncbi:MAG: lipopolysaccharide heptosyltransferase II [Deltaproteobacteria bacterium]|nr:lipopolysaccharide heptosyltransferase II [Deltaproteobacteria bacterium]